MAGRSLPRTGAAPAARLTEREPARGVEERRSPAISP